MRNTYLYSVCCQSLRSYATPAEMAHRLTALATDCVLLRAFAILWFLIRAIGTPRESFILMIYN